MDMSLIENRKMLAEVLTNIHPMSGQCMEQLISGFEYCEFGKKEIITRPGEIAKNLYFILEGTQRSYLLKDKEYTIAFSYHPNLGAIPDSFILQRPSKHYFESITPSKMLRITKTKLDDLIEKYPELNKLMLRYHEMMIVGLHDRQTELMSMSMEERFEVFCERSFHLFGKVPHKHIASYLNMDPTNMSKLLNKKLV